MVQVAVMLSFVLGVLLLVYFLKILSLRQTKAEWMEEQLPFTVYATVHSPDEAEYTVRCAVERIKWLDLHGMCRLVCLNPDEDPEIDTIFLKLAQKYPFVQIGSLQMRKNVL